jgi:hypothetical protein
MREMTEERFYQALDELTVPATERERQIVIGAMKFARKHPDNGITQFFKSESFKSIPPISPDRVTITERERMIAELIEPVLVKAGDDRVKLGCNLQPPPFDCRVVAEVQYQKMMAIIRSIPLASTFEQELSQFVTKEKERLWEIIPDATEVEQMCPTLPFEIFMKIRNLGEYMGVETVEDKIEQLLKGKQ